MLPFLLSQALQNYWEKPFIFNARQAIAAGELIKNGEGFTLKFLGLNNNTALYISRNNFYDMLVPTFMGLNDALIHTDSGENFRVEFEKEFQVFIDGMDDWNESPAYGNYVYYPYSGHLVQYAPEQWHYLALLASNARLHTDEKQSLNWHELREIFKSFTPAIAGASVGSKIADAFIKLFRPKELIIADFASFKTGNANRTDISYDDIVLSKGQEQMHINNGEFRLYAMQNKAISFAKRMQRLDPYITIYPIQEGITKENVTDFVSRASVVIEEIDLSMDIEAKIFIRDEARKQSKLFIMMTDLGSAVQWDIRPFHIDNTLPLTIECNDEELYKSNINASKSREGFYQFMEVFLGDYFWQSGELADTMKGKLTSVVSSVPQLGSITSIAAGVCAELLARIILGKLDIYERGVIDMRNQTLNVFGKKLNEFIK